MRKERKQLEKIDAQILALMKERQRIAARIGKHKLRLGLRIRDHVREAELLSRYTRKAVHLGLSAVAVAHIFRKLMAESRKKQQEVMVVSKKVRTARKSVRRK